MDSTLTVDILGGLEVLFPIQKSGGEAFWAGRRGLMA
jgi:hypothetical protein